MYVSGTLNYEIIDSDPEDNLNNNQDEDNESQASTVPESDMIVLTYNGNETYILHGNNISEVGEGVEDSDDEDEIMEVSMKDIMDEKAQEKGEKSKPTVEQPVEENLMEIDVTPVLKPKPSRMLSLIKRYSSTGSTSDRLRRLEEPAGIRKPEARVRPETRERSDRAGLWQKRIDFNMAILQERDRYEDLLKAMQSP